MGSGVSPILSEHLRGLGAHSAEAPESETPIAAELFNQLQSAPELYCRVVRSRSRLSLAVIHQRTIWSRSSCRVTKLHWINLTRR